MKYIKQVVFLLFLNMSFLTYNLWACQANPLASASGYGTYELGSTVVLDGSASYDPDGGTIATYKWECYQVPTGSTVCNTQEGPSHTFSFQPDLPGKYTVDLKVKDDEGAWSGIFRGYLHIEKTLNVYPLDGAWESPVVFSDLQWKYPDESVYASGADIYLGTDKSAVQNATQSSPEYKGYQTSLTYNPGPLNSDHIYFWRIDEHLSASDKPAWNTTGGQDDPNYLNFDSSKREFLQLPFILNPSQTSFTASVWVRRTSSDYMSILQQADGVGSGVGHRWLAIEADGDVLTSVKKYTGSDLSTTTQPILNNQWFHIAVVWDKIAQIRRIYVNGVSVANDLTSIGGNLEYSIGPMFLGTNKDGTANFMNGDLDGVRIYDTPLTTNNIKYLHNGSGDDPGVTNLKAWWKFKEGSGDVTVSDEGNLYNAVLKSSSTTMNTLLVKGDVWDFGIISTVSNDGDTMPDYWEEIHSIPNSTDTDDTDGDGLNNLAEYNNGTNPRDWDTDNDGMDDNWEVSYKVSGGLNPLVDDAGVDGSDEDGIHNIYEYTYRVELYSNGLSPSVIDAAADPDNDLLTNLVEFTNNTNPLSADTDGDGMSDKWEIDNNLNPVLARIFDDTDGDGMTDVWEHQHSLNPQVDDSASTSGDADNWSNLMEFTYGADPTADNTGDGWTESVYNSEDDMVASKAFELTTSGITILSETIYDYDDLGRVWRVRQKANPNGALDDVNDNVQLIAYHINGSVAATAQKDPSNTTSGGASKIEIGDIATSYIYDTLGRPTSVTDALNQTTDYQYDKNGRVIQTDFQGSPISYAEYDQGGRLTKQTDAEGHYSLSKYNSLGNVIRVLRFTNGTGPALSAAISQQRMYYDNLGDLTRDAQLADATNDDTYTPVIETDRITDYENVYHISSLSRSTYTYSGSNQSTRAVSTNTLFDKSLKGLPTVVLEGYQLGQSYNLHYQYYDTAGRMTLKVKMPYTESGSLLSPTTEGYVYDTYGRRSIVINDTTSTDLTTSYTYDGVGRQVEVVDPKGLKVQYQYDGLGRLTRKTEDVDNIARHTDYDYDRLSRLVRIIGNDGTNAQTTDYQYDKLGRETLVKYPDGDFVNDNVTYQYDALGKVTQRIDQKGNQTNYAYDKLGQLTSKDNNLTGTSKITESYTYDARGLMLTAQKGTDTSSDNVARSMFAYNDLGYLTQNKQTIHGGSEYTTNYTRDQLGQATGVDYPNTSTSRLNMGYTYTSLGQVDTISKIIDQGPPLVSTLLVDYDYGGSFVDQRVYHTTTALTHKQVYDDLGRVTDLEIQKTGGNPIDFTYTYDNNGNTTDQKFNHRTSLPTKPTNDYQYDTLDRLTKAEYLDVITDYEQFTYDQLGNRQSVRKRDGDTVGYSHNIASEYTGISGSALLHYRMNDTAASTTVVDSSVSSYNGTAQQNTSSLTTTGKMNTALSFDGSTDYIDVNKNSSELGLTSERTYVVWFKTSLTQGTQANLVGNYQWIPGNIDYGIGLGFKNGDIRIDVGNGTSTDQEFTWTPPSSYTGSWHHVAMTWDGNTIKLYYDGAEKLSQTAILADSTHDYVLGKWTDYWAAGKYNGDMDSVMIFDRVLSASDITALYNETNETTLTTMMVGTDAISYDANGNIAVDRKGYQYDYDYENRLERIKDSSLNVIAEFTYDALGRRVETIEYDSTNITTRYYYDGWRVLSETDASNVVHRDYVYGNYIDETVMMVDHASSSDYFYGHDHLFSTVALFDSSGATVERYEYDAYGKAVVITNKGSDGIWYTSDDMVAMTSAKGNPYTFTGRRLDTYDSGAYEVMYYRNRYYDTETGRFLERDPFGYVDGLNLLRFIFNNPINNIDPFGLQVVAPVPTVPVPYPVYPQGPYNPFLPPFGVQELPLPPENPNPQNPDNPTPEPVPTPTPEPERNPNNDLDPPGDCTPERLAALEALKKIACLNAANAGTCTGPPGGVATEKYCLDLKRKYRLWDKCRNLRRKINDECFRGGDDGHQDQTRDIGNILNKCITNYSKYCLDIKCP